MTKTVELSNLLEQRREKIAAAAAEAGLTLREYVDRQLREATALSNSDVFALLLSLPPADPKLDSAEIIRELRGPLPSDVEDHR